MDFYNLYAHGFARVAACTLPIAMVQPRKNAEAVLAQARECADAGACLAVFPELCLTGYSIEDLLMQDTVLDAVQDALAWLVPQTEDLGCIVVVGAPLVSLNRIYNCAVVIHRGTILGVVPKAYLPTYREFYERRQIAPGDDVTGEIRVAGEDVPFGCDLLFAADDVPGFVLNVEICEDMWVPIPTCPGTARRWSTRRGRCWPSPSGSRTGRARPSPTWTSAPSCRTGCVRAPSTTTAAPTPSGRASTGR